MPTLQKTFTKLVHLKHELCVMVMRWEHYWALDRISEGNSINEQSRIISLGSESDFSHLEQSFDNKEEAELPDKISIEDPLAPARPQENEEAKDEPQFPAMNEEVKAEENDSDKEKLEEPVTPNTM